jgi:hypothetical protein
MEASRDDNISFSKRAEFIQRNNCLKTRDAVHAQPVSASTLQCRDYKAECVVTSC